MRQESGRSLIEVIGVFAIGAVMTAGAIAMYNMIRNRQQRTIATAELEQIAKNTRLLLSMRGDYTGVSVDYLIKAGALKNNNAPIGSSNWTVTSSVDGTMFSINLTGLTGGECDYFTTVPLAWTSKITVNGYETDPGTYCLTSGANEISFVVQ